MACFRTVTVVIAAFVTRETCASLQNETMKPNVTKIAKPEPSEATTNYWRDAPCDVREITRRGDQAAYYLYNRVHDKYMSTDGSNVDLWHTRGSHSRWHLEHVAGTSVNRFYVKNDMSSSYLSSSGESRSDYDNVEVWSSDCGALWSWLPWCGRGDSQLQWLIFAADEITVNAPACTFYIMHSESHRWLETNGNNVHAWRDSYDVFDLGSTPENLQWEFVVARY